MPRREQELKFPDKFLWGASISAHQIEGGNFNDWTEWEKANAQRLTEKAKKKWQFWQQGRFPEMLEAKNYISGEATDHYRRYEEDFDLAKKLNFNALRISIEWARIEPEEGKFSNEATRHYQDVIKALKKRKIEPFVTLWHFTNPIWFRDQGGWENGNAPQYFLSYVRKVVSTLSDVKFWITLNEPGNYVSQGFITGEWTPEERNFVSALKVVNNLKQAHALAYRTIKEASPSAKVGIAEGIAYFEPYRNSLVNRLIKKILEPIVYYFLNSIKKTSDFIGLNFYHRGIVNLFSVNIGNRQPMSDLGWELYPKGIYFVLRKLKKYKKPIYITENGLADGEDKKRKWYIKEILRSVHDAISEGVDVRGYLHWALLDNFEWDKGFWPRFGLIEVNYKNMKRKIRQSAKEYAKIIKENALSF